MCITFSYNSDIIRIRRAHVAHLKIAFSVFVLALHATGSDWYIAPANSALKFFIKLMRCACVPRVAFDGCILGESEVNLWLLETRESRVKKLVCLDNIANGHVVDIPGWDKSQCGEEDAGMHTDEPPSKRAVIDCLVFRRFFVKFGTPGAY